MVLLGSVSASATDMATTPNFQTLDVQQDL